MHVRRIGPTLLLFSLLAVPAPGLAQNAVLDLTQIPRSASVTVSWRP